MNKKIVISLCIFITIVATIFTLAIGKEFINTNASPSPEDYMVLMNGHTSEDPALLKDQPSYIKIYDAQGNEKASYDLDSHWDYINYNENNEIVLYNETTKMCGIFDYPMATEEAIKPYSCEDIYSTKMDNIILGGGIYMEKDGSVLNFEEEPTFNVTYNEIETKVYIVDFVQIKH